MRRETNPDAGLWTNACQTPPVPWLTVALCQVLPPSVEYWRVTPVIGDVAGPPATRGVRSSRNVLPAGARSKSSNAPVAFTSSRGRVTVSAVWPERNRQTALTFVDSRDQVVTRWPVTDSVYQAGAAGRVNSSPSTVGSDPMTVPLW